MRKTIKIIYNKIIIKKKKKKHATNCFEVTKKRLYRFMRKCLYM